MLWKKFIYLALINIDLVPDVLSSLSGVHSLLSSVQGIRGAQSPIKYLIRPLRKYFLLILLLQIGI